MALKLLQVFGGVIACLIISAVIADVMPRWIAAPVAVIGGGLYVWFASVTYFR